MLQAPTSDTVPKTTAILWTAGAGIVGWLVKSFLMSGFKQAVLDAVTTELDRRFKALEAHNEERFNKINERIDVLAERRRLPRGGNGGHT